MTGYLLLGMGFILAPLCIPLVYLVTPYFILLFPVLMLGGLIKIFVNRHYLGTEASRLLWAALIIFILSLFVVGLADARFVGGAISIALLLVLSTFSLLFILYPVAKRRIMLATATLLLLFGSLFIGIPSQVTACLGILLLPIGTVIYGILSFIACSRLRKGELDPVMMVDASERRYSDKGDIDLDIQNFLMPDGEVMTLRHNYKARRIVGTFSRVFFALLAVGLIIAGAWCAASAKEFLIEKYTSQEQEDAQDAQSGDTGTDSVPETPGNAMLEGRVGILRFLEMFLFRDTPQNNDVVEDNDDLDFLNITDDMFTLSYHDIVIYDNGSIYDASKDRYIVLEGEDEGNTSEGQSAPDDDSISQTHQGPGSGSGQDTEQEEAQETFPIGGVEKRSYTIYDALYNGSVEARYQSEARVQGRTCYVYNVKFMNKTIGETTDFDGNTFSAYTDEDTLYFLDQPTSIPLNLNLRILIGLRFPDLTRLQADLQESVDVSYVQVFTKDPDTGMWGMQEVREERHRSTTLDQDDKNILWFETWTMRYYNSTGEPLPPDQQDTEHERYAVDRTTYRYVPGMGNTQRRGYYAFPVGHLEAKNYDMWDEFAQQTGVNRFTGRYFTTEGREVYEFEMRSENFTIDASSLLLPIDINNPGAVTLVGDSVVRWWLDKETSIPINLEQELVVSVRSGGPMHQVKEPVYRAHYTISDQDRENLTKVAHVMAIILNAISGKNLPVLTADLQFTNSFQKQLADIAQILEYVFDSLDYYIPAIAISVGVFIMVLVVLRTIIIHKKRKRMRERNREMLDGT